VSGSPYNGLTEGGNSENGFKDIRTSYDLFEMSEVLTAMLMKIEVICDDACRLEDRPASILKDHQFTRDGQT
jgi:hypothetical protein